MKQSKFDFLLQNQPAGTYGLPAEVAAAHAAYVRLASHTIPEPAHTNPEADAAVELLRAARAGEKLLTRVNRADQDTEAKATDTARTALRLAQGEALADFDAIAQDNLDLIVRDCLSPVYAELMAEARKIGPAVAEVSSPIDVARADAKTRAAVVRFEELSTRYGVIRQTWPRVNLHHEVKWQNDELANTYAEVRNPGDPDVWPDFNRLQHQVRAAEKAPWQHFPTNRDRLLWFIQHPAARTWMPTPAEVNALVEERHAEEINNHRDSMMRGRAFKAWAA